MTDQVVGQKPAKPRKSGWWWPGIVATSLAGAAAIAFRGCWHTKMSWPLSVQGYSYRVCLNCGAMRLFDEKTFKSYGPVRYSLNALIAWEKSSKGKSGSMGETDRPASQAVKR
jgi:hypothetical protein